MTGFLSAAVLAGSVQMLPFEPQSGIRFFAPFILKAHTTRGDYFVPADLPDLDVDMAGCDHFAATLDRELGITLPRYQYIRVETSGDVSFYAGVYAAGLAFGDTSRIISVENCSRHELAHLATYILGRPDGLLEEGVAAMLGGDYNFFDRWNARRMARHAKESYSKVNDAFLRRNNTAADPGSYLIAEGFVQHLRSDYGAEKLIALLRLCSTHSTRFAFQSVYRTPIEKEFNQWLYGNPDGPSQK